ncbi:MAG TPA: porin [Acidiferrobacterales bacterium]|nr:porin [Acidiferrobacterales bacterium]
MNANKRWTLSAISAACIATTASVFAAEDAPVTRAEFEELQRQVQEAGDWRKPESHAHLAGYGAVSYIATRASGVNNSFGEVRFNPIFHYQYRDLMLLESELELAIDADGTTVTKLEYLSLDLFVSDSAILVAGKFLSPLGQYRQNLHPLWINKLPSAPAGFGEEQAVPMNEVGLQVRGGVPLGAARLNYALYAGNGPELAANGTGMLMPVMADGVTRDADGRPVVGGRIGLLPIPKLEFGLSAARGRATVTINGGAPLTGDPLRDYDAYGADLNYSTGGLRLLAEYIAQKVGASAASVAPDAAEWRAWYAQVSYLFATPGWEAVLRYADYSAPEMTRDQKQTAAGVNYWFAPHVVAKLAYEFNNGDANTAADANRALAQIAYGF